LVVYNGGWYIFGGTSVAAPTLAGEIALADQGRTTPLSSNNLASRTEYNAAAGSLYAANYRDITTGSNGYAATVGYDLATGLGAPLANNLVPWLKTNA
jgi:subtilase family serine protease